MIIAIDGPAGSGKSTISKVVSKKLNIVYLDTGAMYRATTLYFLEKNINLQDIESIKKALLDIKIDFNGDNIFLNSKDVSKEIRQGKVNSNVSNVSAILEVRTKMVELQRKMSENKSVILDGRDIGTVVFPNADYKFYLTADVDTRAKRRFEEEKNKNFKNINLEEIKKSIENRDFIDSKRENSPLKKAYDAIEIDTSNLNIDEVVEEILKHIR